MLTFALAFRILFARRSASTIPRSSRHDAPCKIPSRRVATTPLPGGIWRTRAKFRYRHRLCGRCLYVAADFVEDASSRTDISDVCTWKMPFCTHAKCPDYGNFSCRSSGTRLLFTHMPLTRHARVHLLIAPIYFLESCISPAIAGWQIAHLSKLKRIDPQHVAHL